MTDVFVNLLAFSPSAIRSPMCTAETNYFVILKECRGPVERRSPPHRKPGGPKYGQKRNPDFWSYIPSLQTPTRRRSVPRSPDKNDGRATSQIWKGGS